MASDLATRFDGATDTETAVLRKLDAGEPADLRGKGDKAVLRGEFVRQLALDTPRNGVRIFGARIEGSIDLADSQIGALALEACEIADTIHLASARTGRVSVRGSRFKGLAMRNAHVAGGLDFASTAPFADQAWVDAGNATIVGALDGNDATLKAPPARPYKDVLPWEHNYALRISEARVHGTVWLNGGFVADGGFTMDDAFVHGSVKCRGATFIAGEGDPFHPGDSFRAHTAKIDGHCEFGFGFKTIGRIFMVGCRIRDRLSFGMIRGELSKPAETWDWMGRTLNPAAALMADQIDVSGAMIIMDSQIDGAISLNDAKIGANAKIFNTTISSKTPGGQTIALTADRASFGHGLSIGPKARFEGRSSMTQAKIRGHLEFKGAVFENEGGMALDAEWIEVDDALVPADAPSHAGGDVVFNGGVSFAHARIGRR